MERRTHRGVLELGGLGRGAAEPHSFPQVVSLRRAPYAQPCTQAPSQTHRPEGLRDREVQTDHLALKSWRLPGLVHTNSSSPGLVMTLKNVILSSNDH